MIELTVQEMINCIPVLKEIMEKQMAARTAYKFARISKEIDRENQIFQDTRRNLIMEYGEKDANGKLVEDGNGNITIVKDRAEDFQKEVDDLINATISINAEKISVDELGDSLFSPAWIRKIEMFME